MPQWDTQLYKSITERLDRLQIRELFTEELLWGPPGNSSSLTITAAGEELEVTEQARLGSVSIYRIDWPAEKLPGVVARREVRSRLSASHAQEHVVCYVSADGGRLAFSYARAAPGGGQEMRTLSYEVEASSRTTIEQLGELAFSLRDLSEGEPAVSELSSRLSSAFDVEALTKSFFEHYRQIFEGLEQRLTTVEDDQQRRLFVQRLMGRLMFVRFLEEKGWVRLGGRRDYLKALWESYQESGDNESFYSSRLKPLFFNGLNSSEIGDPEGLTGETPYLNGGLFEPSELDSDERINVPDEAVEPLFSQLLYRYNFTVTESTPFEVEVAVDPEMLGRIFEELVTGRHEVGAYYTPRPIVSFMCREALTGYLQSSLTGATEEGVGTFVEERDPSGLPDPESALAALRNIRVVDPACGSGAYLLGMLTELLELREALFAAHASDHATTYRRKLEIIEKNLYGVDMDSFAVGMGRLRLWLSLVVDDGRDPLSDPMADVSLPNLDFKLEVGDSLAAPDPSGGLEPDLIRAEQIQRFDELKGSYLGAHTAAEKESIRDEIETTREEIRRGEHAGGDGREGFDWRVEFAEVFADGGFDVVVANPPYVRQELIKDQKPTLKKVYENSVYVGTADLYVYFYARGVELLKDGGMLSFISSNKWFRADYGKKLRAHLTATSQIRSITDFGDLPVFQDATAYPVIFAARKEHDDRRTQFTEVESLDPPYPDVAALIRQSGEPLPPEAIDGEDWLLTDAKTAARLTQMRATGIPLGEYVKGQIYYGIKTGFNEAFIIDGAKREELISRDPRSAEIIKPFAVGRDIRKWSIDYKDRWLIFTRRGVNINEYPAIKEHLAQWKAELTPKSNSSAKVGRKPGPYKWYEIQDNVAYYEEFTKPKIVYPVMVKERRFAFDTEGASVNDKAFIVPLEDLYLLGVLNSGPAWEFTTEICSKLRGGFYELRDAHLSKVPIPDAPAADREAIAELVQGCLDASGVGCEEAEREIDERVAGLYGVDVPDSG